MEPDFLSLWRPASRLRLRISRQETIALGQSLLAVGGKRKADDFRVGNRKWLAVFALSFGVSEEKKTECGEHQGPEASGAGPLGRAGRWRGG